MGGMCKAVPILGPGSFDSSILVDDHYIVDHWLKILHQDLFSMGEAVGTDTRLVIAKVAENAHGTRHHTMCEVGEVGGRSISLHKNVNI